MPQVMNSFDDFPAYVKDYLGFKICEVQTGKMLVAYEKNKESVNFSNQEFNFHYDGEIPNEFKTEKTKMIEEMNKRTAKIRAKFGFDCVKVDFGVDIPRFLDNDEKGFVCPKSEDEWKIFYNHVLKTCYEEIKHFYKNQKKQEEWLETEKKKLIESRKQQEAYNKKFVDIMNSLPKTCDAKQHRELCKELDNKTPFKRGYKSSTWSKLGNTIQIVFNKE